MGETITGTLKAVRAELNVGDIFRCPEDHKAKIVWISEDKKVVAVVCPQEHLKKVASIDTAPARPYRNQHREKRENYVKNMVFLIRT